VVDVRRALAGLALAVTLMTGCGSLLEGGTAEAAPMPDEAPTTQDPRTEYVHAVSKYCLDELDKVDGRSFSTAEVFQEWLNIYAGVLEGLVFTMASLEAPPGAELEVQALVADVADVAAMMRSFLSSSVDAAHYDARMFQLQSHLDDFGLIACDLV